MDDTMRECAECLAYSFMNEPQFETLLPKNKRARFGIMNSFFSMLVEYCNTLDSVVYNDEITGVILYLPPEKLKISPRGLIKAGAIRAFFRMGVKFSVGILKRLSKNTGIEASIASTPHIKPIMFGVHPDHRGKGIATDLLKLFWDKVEKYNLPIFVETHTTYASEVYKHFGASVEMEDKTEDLETYGMFYDPKKEKEGREQILRDYEQRQKNS